MLSTDRELTEKDILGLSSAGAVVGFLASLGYRTEARTVQAPANLGITAESLVHQIRRIELLADHEGLLQVYLVELTSVTVAATRGLARAFRTLNVQFPLLILTHDYERLDFVLVEKVLPVSGDDGGPMGQKQVAIRPRILTVDRRDPSRVELRVLRRFTYSEADPIAQGEKLLSAYAVADWSEEFFNNRALFSDYFLLERLRDDPVWNEDPKPAYRIFRDLYASARSRWAGKPETEVRAGLLIPALKALGFDPRAGKEAGDGRVEPDFRLYAGPGEREPIGLCLAYPWDRHLDGKDSKDIESPEENPGQAIVSLLEEGEAQWAIVTNGKHWRLYSAKAHSRATNYYEIDLEEVLAADNKDPQDSFRYFWLLFRQAAFRLPDCFLDHLLRGSAEYAKRLGERLKERVFEGIFPHLAEGFIEYAKAKKVFSAGDAEATEEFLNQVFQGTLTLLYRLLFLLYAESRDLLPVKEYRGYYQKSLTRLKQEVVKGAGDIGDEVPEHLGKVYRKDSTGLYDRLLALFHLVDQGSKDDNLPAYNGGLFLSKPDPEDTSDEAEVARFLLSHKVPDFYLARGLDLLARDEDEKTFKWVFIDYKSLGVRQLGSIYEGLLEFKLRIASEKLGIVKVKGKDVYKPWRELSDSEKAKLEKPEAKESLVVRKGDVFLENDKRERKATGSYYTPDHIVKYIVEHAVGPILKERFEGVTPKIRDAQKRYRQRLDSLKAMGKSLPEHELAKTYGREVVDELFDIKVLDPAMGSGHFLVQAVDFITDRMLDFLNGFPWNPVMAMLEETRRTILSSMEDLGITIDAGRLTDVNLLKRHVLKRCIYGVDLNPMAVELAKVSLWLDCFTLGAPLSFLDHHLRCGNSLVGVTVDEVRKAAETGQLSLLSGGRFEGMKQAVAGMIHVGGLSDVTIAQARESRQEYRRASGAIGPAKRLLDIYTSQWFGNRPTASGYGKKRVVHNHAVEFLRDAASESWADSPGRARLPKEWKEVTSIACRAAAERRFFHWELEFPEVFYGPRKGAAQVIERMEDAGFDAVIGNPPYVRVQELRQSDSETADFLGLRYCSAVKNFDIYLPFFEVGLSLTKNQVSYIAPNKWFATDYGEGLRKLVTERSALARVVDFRDFQLFPDATNYTCILALSRKPKESFVYVDASSGELGQEQLRHMKELPSDCGAWTFASGQEAALLGRLLGGRHPCLGELRDRAFQGLRTSDNEAYVLHSIGRALKGLLPMTSRATGQAHEIETALLKPLLSGDEIRAFSLTHGDQWILFPYDLSGQKPTLLSEQRLRREYPGAWDYLKKCEGRLRARERGKMDEPGWWAFGRSQNLDQFEQRKVILPDYHDRPAAALDGEGKFYSITAYCLTLQQGAPITLRMLVCLLNSDLLFWVLAKIGTALQRGFVRFMPQYLDKLPIVLPDPQQGRALENIARRGMLEGYEGVKADLNETVYRLYGLTGEEIRIVEGSA